MPKGGTIRLKTRAMQTKTAGRTIYKQALEREETTGQRFRSPRSKPWKKLASPID